MHETFENKFMNVLIVQIQYRPVDEFTVAKTSEWIFMSSTHKNPQIEIYKDKRHKPKHRAFGNAFIILPPDFIRNVVII